MARRKRFKTWLEERFGHEPKDADKKSTSSTFNPTGVASPSADSTVVPVTDDSKDHTENDKDVKNKDNEDKGKDENNQQNKDSERYENHDVEDQAFQDNRADQDNNLKDSQTDQELRITLDLWAEAYQNVSTDPELVDLLEKFEKYIADGKIEPLDGKSDTSLDRGLKRLDKIQSVAESKLSDLSSNDTNSRLSFSIGGKQIVVRDAVRNVVTAISNFKGIIGAAVSAEPHASLVWAGVMTIVPVLENAFQQDEDAAEGLTNLVFLLLRYHMIETRVLPEQFRNASRSDENRHKLLENIKDTMVKIYQKAYEYEIRFVIQYARGRAARTARNAVTADNWKLLWADIESLSRQVDMGLKDCMHVETLDIRQSVGRLESKAERIEVAVLDGNRRRLLDALPDAKTALFDSNQVASAENQCLEGTRLDVLNDIQDWVEDPEAELIYWLHGMAGTGKTSVSLTVANALNDGQVFTGSGHALSRNAFLGGSFFFKQGVAIRNTTELFYTTIARHLAQKSPDLMVQITEYISSDSAIGSKLHKKQFDELIRNPLSRIDKTAFPSLRVRLIVIIDALDECDNPREAEELLSMLENVKELRHIQLRFLITSRADDHIVRVFEQLPRSLYRSFALEKVPYYEGDMKQTDDITRYLAYTLGRIAEKQRIPKDWISEADITRLSKKADGLFIYAATTCRLLETTDLSESSDETPQEVLDLILNDENNHETPQQKVDDIYSKVLSFQRLSLPTESSRRNVFTWTKKILGFIVVFFEPVSASSLADFLPLERSKLTKYLRRLHAVIFIPEEENAPLSVMHLSFRDFLLSEERAGQLFYDISREERVSWWVPESSMHFAILERCLAIMSAQLREDICKLVLPGVLISEIDPNHVESHISPALQYACCYWVRHLERFNPDQRREMAKDGGQVDQFLRRKLLFWLEAMSLLRKGSAAVLMVIQLDLFVKDLECTRLADLVQDARRFVLANRWIIEHAPLQLYSSALLFSPMESQLRSEFEHLIPPWITKKPRVEEEDGGQVIALEGHAGLISIAFAPSANLLVSGSTEGLTRIWDCVTGTAIYERVDLYQINCVDFSPNSRAFASGSVGGKVRVTEFDKGRTTTLCNSSSDSIMSVAFSPRDPNILALLSSSGTLHLWDVASCCELFTLETPDKDPQALAFSPDGEFVAVGSGNRDNSDSGVIRLWGAENGTLRRTSCSHKGGVGALAISLDGKIVASASSGTLMLWDVATDKIQHVEGSDYVREMVFCPANGDLVALSVGRGNLELRHIKTWERVGFYYCSSPIRRLAYSRDGNLVATACQDGTIRLWDISKPQVVQERQQRDVSSVALLPGNSDRFVVEDIEDGILIWDAQACAPETTYPSIHALQISPNERFVALTVPTGVELWNSDLKICIERYQNYTGAGFSPDGRRIALRSPDKLRILDCTPESTLPQAISTLDIQNQDAVEFSPDGRVVACLANKLETLHLWDIAQGTELVRYSCPAAVSNVALSPDGTLVAFQEGNPLPALEDEGTFVITVLEVRSGKVRMRLRVPIAGLISGSRIYFGFPLQSQLLAFSDGDHIAMWGTGSQKEEFAFKPVFDQDERHIIKHLAFCSRTGKIVASFLPYNAFRLLDNSPVIILWDVNTRTEIGRYSVAISLVSFQTLSFSANSQHLECEGGRLPLPAASRWAGAVRNNLYVGAQWIHQGFERLLWLPPAYRKFSSSAVRGGTVLLGCWNRANMVLRFEFDLARTPWPSQTKGIQKETWPVDFEIFG